MKLTSSTSTPAQTQMLAGRLEQTQSKPIETEEMPVDSQANKNTISERDVVKAIEKANKALKVHSTQLEFSIHEKTKEIMVKVLDQETKEVIREIPPEKVLDMVAKLWELAGLFVDERR